jgi:hypothetical protein
VLLSGLIAALLLATAGAQNSQATGQSEIKAPLERVRAPMYGASGATVPGKTATYSFSGTGCSARLEVSYPSHQILSMMEPIVEIEKDEWLSVPNMLKQHSGGTRRWTLQTLGWVNNPEGASHPGRYAFVKVTGSYPKIAAYRGTLVIYRQRPGSYLVTQQNRSVIPESWISSGRTTRAEALKTCDQ